MEWVGHPGSPGGPVASGQLPGFVRVAGVAGRPFFLFDGPFSAFVGTGDVFLHHGPFDAPLTAIIYSSILLTRFVRFDAITSVPRSPQKA